MEAYLKKLCFEYQVDEREVKELLARMEMVYLDKGETIASATMPEQSLYIIVSGILHTYTTHEGEERTNRFFSAGDAVLCYNSSQYSIKTLTKCAAYYISEEEIEELCASSISFANLVRQLMEYQFYFKEEEDMNARKLTVRERYLSLLAEIPDILYRVPLKHINHYLGQMRPVWDIWPEVLNRKYNLDIFFYVFLIRWFMAYSIESNLKSLWIIW